MNKRITILLVILILIIQICTISFAETEEITDQIIEKIEDEVNVGETEKKEDEIEWTDFSKAKITFEKDTSGTLKLAIHLSGVEFKKDHFYYMCIGEKDSIAPKNFLQKDSFFQREGKDYRETTIPNQYVMLNKTYYYIITEQYQGEEKQQTEVKAIPEAELPAYGERLDLFMPKEGESTGFQLAYPTSSEYKRKMNYKIGKVDDINILKKFKTDKAQAYKELMEYSKKAKYIKTGTVNVDTNNFNPIDNVNIEKNQYYFAYLSLDNENGKYKDMVDMAIYQECDTKLVHFAFANMQFDENTPTLKNDGVHTTTPTTDEKDPTIAKDPIPYTGKIAIGLVSIILIILTYIFYRKNKNLRDI